MSNPQHLPPEALDEWLASAATELGLEPGSVDIATVLNVARDVAHQVARPAAPLSTFLLGVAVGRAAAEAQNTTTEANEAAKAALTTQAQALTELAEQWAAKGA